MGKNERRKLKLAAMREKENEPCPESAENEKEPNSKQNEKQTENDSNANDDRKVDITESSDDR